MSNHDGRRPILHLPNFKEDDLVPSIVLPDEGSSLSPDIKSPGFSPDFTSASVDDTPPPGLYERIGPYLLLDHKLSSTPAVEVRNALHVELQEEFICKVSK